MNSREVLNCMTYITCHCDDRYIVKTTDILSRKIEGLPKGRLYGTKTQDCFAGKRTAKGQNRDDQFQ